MKSRLIENVFVLYVVHVFNYVVPLVMIPYLARHLGPSGWGEFALAEAFARYITLFVEYGFSLSGTREVARRQDSPEIRSRLLGGIIAAQCLLSIVSVVLAVLASRLFPAFRMYPVLFWSGVAWGVLDAFNLMWYFQGIERTRIVGAIDVGARMLGVILIVVFVRTADDGWKAFLFRGIGSGLSLVLCLRMAYREMPLRRPDLAGAREMLRSGFSLFLLRSSVNVYLLANVLILGLFAPARIVGIYAGAEKISRAAIAMLNPITQAVYPRVTQLLETGAQSAAKLVRVSLAVMGAGSMIASAGVFVLAPLIVRILLGKGFEESVIILRLLCLLYPFVAMNNVLGIQWLIPHGLDKAFNLITAAGGVISIVVCFELAPRLMQLAPVWGTLAAEVTMFLVIIVTCGRFRINPLGRIEMSAPADALIETQ